MSLCELFGIGTSEGGKSLRPITGTSKEVLDLSRLLAALVELVPTYQIGSWLETSNPVLEGSTPVQVIERGELIASGGCYGS
jgi:hypothetical protein